VPEPIALLDFQTALINEFMNEYNITNETVMLDSYTLQIYQLDRIADAGLSVTFTLPMGTFTLDPDAVKSTLAAASGADIAISLTKADNLTEAQLESINPEDLVFKITMMAIDSEGSVISYINSFDGYITVTVPYHGHMPVAVWYLCNDGMLEGVWFRYDRQEQTVSFMTNHLSLYVVAPITESYPNGWMTVAVTGIISIIIAGVFFVFWHKRENKKV